MMNGLIIKLFFCLFLFNSSVFAVSSPYGNCAGHTCPAGRLCTYDDTSATAQAACQSWQASHPSYPACQVYVCDYPCLSSWYSIDAGGSGTNAVFGCGSSTQSCTTQRTAASQQCGGDDKYIISDAPSCTYACKDSCSTISNTTVTPLQNCVEQCSQIDGHCGSSGYSMYDGQNCKGTCNPSGDCAQKYEQKSIECKQHIAYWDNATCTGVCEECEQQYLAIKQECANPLPIYSSYNGISDIDRCKYTCDCTEAMDQANADCPYGAEFQSGTNGQPPSCNYKCLSCEQLADKCVEKCGTKDNVSVYNCEALNTIPSDYICECKGNDCKSYYDSCERSCSTDECAGVKEMKCVEAFGIISYRNCECNACAIDGKPEKETCSNYTDNCANACSSAECGGVGAKQCTDTSTGISNQSCTCRHCGDKIVDGTGTGGSGTGGSGTGGGGTGTPTSDPSDNSDVGWLKSIKGNTDDLVRQGEDQSNWLADIDKNGESTNDLLKQLLMKNTNVTVGGTDVSGVVTAVNNAGETLGDIKSGLTDVGIGAAVGTYTGNEMSEGGYGTAPTDADLPTAAQADSAFGTLTLREGDSYAQVSNALSGLSVGATGAACLLTLKLPVLVGWTWEWREFPVDFCPYGNALSTIGSFLVFAAALYELYKMS